MPTIKVIPNGLKMKDISRKVFFEMKWLRKNGLTLDKIGKIYGVSRQRVHQIIRGK